jgi:hypothetical protein
MEVYRVALAEFVEPAAGSFGASSNIEQDVSQRIRIVGCDAEEALEQEGLMPAHRVLWREAVAGELALINEDAVCIRKEHAHIVAAMYSHLALRTPRRLPAARPYRFVPSACNASSV